MAQDRFNIGRQGLSVSTSRHARWLDDLDQAVDWPAFDRYFLWLQRSGSDFRHQPLQLFKSLLLRNWFSLSALEFNDEMADRKSFRTFVGLAMTADVPRHHEIMNFQALLISRSVATDVAREFEAQVNSLEIELPDDIYRGLAGLDTAEVTNGLVSSLWSGATGPDWASLEQRLVNFWENSYRNGNIPTADQIKLSDLADISDYLTLIRVIPGQGFRYEIVGSAIDEANEGSLLGATISDKIMDNIDRHGEPGLQAELSTLFHRVIDTGKAGSLTTYYLNAKLNKCHLMTAQVPVGAASGIGDIDFLLGISLIRKLVIS
jgi:hypothetical protein